MAIDDRQRPNRGRGPGRPAYDQRDLRGSRGCPVLHKGPNHYHWGQRRGRNYLHSLRHRFKWTGRRAIGACHLPGNGHRAPVDLGACQVGMRVRPGESCNYPAGQYQVRFSVKPDGSSCRKSDKPITKEVFGGEVTIRGLGDFCVYYDIRGDDVFDHLFCREELG